MRSHECLGGGPLHECLGLCVHRAMHEVVRGGITNIQPNAGIQLHNLDKVRVLKRAVFARWPILAASENKQRERRQEVPAHDVWNLLHISWIAASSFPPKSSGLRGVANGLSSLL